MKMWCCSVGGHQGFCWPLSFLVDFKYLCFWMLLMGKNSSPQQMLTPSKCMLFCFQSVETHDRFIKKMSSPFCSQKTLLPTPMPPRVLFDCLGSMGKNPYFCRLRGFFAIFLVLLTAALRRGAKQGRLYTVVKDGDRHSQKGGKLVFGAMINQD